MAGGDSQAELALMKRWLLDTGPIVAYLDESDSQHEFVVQRFDRFEGEGLTTTAVITECMHLLAADTRGPDLLLEFLISARIKIFDCADIPELAECVKLMNKYRDIPMDFADATLVLLANRLGVTNICTLDRRGFAAYRTLASKRFTLSLDLPQRAS